MWTLSINIMEVNLKKYNVEMTKEEMIKFYANKIIEDAINGIWGFNIIVESNKYKNISEFKQEIVEEIAEDERISYIELDKNGDFDIVFYTDFCPSYSAEEYEWEKNIN